MENNNEEQTPVDPYKVYADSMQEAADKERIKNENYQRFLAELKTTPRFQTYFQQFTPHSVEMFINSYAFTKAHWIRNAKNNEFMESYEGLKFKDEGEICLKQILQKKLFDLQCQWRAEQIKLPGVESKFDFLNWEQNIFNCPFLEPITQRELEVYIAYMQSSNYDADSFYGWQNYEDIKGFYNDAEEDDDNSPDWYIFYDNQMGGNKGLLLLPDIRGEKEKKYMEFAYAEQNKVIAQLPPPDPRPHLNINYDYPKLRKFLIEVDGDKEVLPAFDLWVSRREKADSWEKEEADRAFRLLEDADEPFPIYGEHTDWKLALIATANQYKKLKTIKALPAVYDEYLFRKQSGIAYPPPENNLGLWDNLKEMVLKGRELAGEPRDFNF